MYDGSYDGYLRGARLLLLFCCGIHVRWQPTCMMAAGMMAANVFDGIMYDGSYDSYLCLMKVAIVTAVVCMTAACSMAVDHC